VNPEPSVVLAAAIGVIGALLTVKLAWDDWGHFDSMLLAVRLKRAVAWGPRYWLALGFLVANGLFLVAWLLMIAVASIPLRLPPSDEIFRQDAAELSGWLRVATEMTLATIQVWWMVVRGRMRLFPHRVGPIPDRVRAVGSVSRPLLHDVRNKLAIAAGDVEIVLAEAALSQEHLSLLHEALGSIHATDPELREVHVLVRSLAPDLDLDAAVTAPPATEGGPS
jgi:hypothetical protein